MKLLLDGNLPHKLRFHLPGHEVYTAAYMQSNGIRNGALLALAAENGFDAVLTMDSRMEYQQNLQSIPCAVAIIRAESNTFEHIEPVIAVLLKTLLVLQPRTLVIIG